MKLNKVYNENCLDTMSRMSDNFINLTVTSPPYDNLRDYEGYSFDFKNIAKELYRVTKEGGVLVWNVSDATIKGSESGTSFRQALFFMDCGFKLHDTMIYKKKRIVPLTHKRYEQGFEYMFVFVKGKLKTFNPIKVPCKYAGTKTWGNTSFQKNSKDRVSLGKMTIGEYKQKDNVWEFLNAKDKNFKHPAPFPVELANDHIISWTNENDLVYDCFIGAGTTAVASLKNKRNYIGSEISDKYCEIAEKRIKTVQPKLF